MRGVGGSCLRLFVACPPLASSRWRGELLIVSLVVAGRQGPDCDLLPGRPPALLPTEACRLPLCYCQQPCSGAGRWAEQAAALLLSTAVFRRRTVG